MSPPKPVDVRYCDYDHQKSEEALSIEWCDNDAVLGRSGWPIGGYPSFSFWVKIPVIHPEVYIGFPKFDESIRMEDSQKQLSISIIIHKPQFNYNYPRGHTDTTR